MATAEAERRAAVTVRPATAADLPTVQAIYAHHVTHGLASFEERAPDLAEITERYRAALDRGDPYLAADLEGAVVGFAYVAPYRPRPAYRFVRESSVYVAPGRERLGIGKALLAALIGACTQAGTRRLIAVIGDSGNRASIGLHECLGFRRAGVLPSVGFKFGRWVDSVLLERPLGEGDTTLPAQAADRERQETGLGRKNGPC